MTGVGGWEVEYKGGGLEGDEGAGDELFDENFENFFSLSLSLDELNNFEKKPCFFDSDMICDVC